MGIISDWNVTEIEDEGGNQYLVFARDAATIPQGKSTLGGYMEGSKVREDDGLGNTETDPIEHFSEVLHPQNPEGDEDIVIVQDTLGPNNSVTQESERQENYDQNSTASNQNPQTNTQGGENTMGRVDDVQQTYEDALDAGKTELEAQSDALEYANQKYNEAEEALSAVQTAVTDLQIDVAQESAGFYRAVGRAEGVRDTVEDNLSDTEDSIEDMRDDLLG